jgi:triacylglycerol esterase/lipase EstA (alpha/beta hydrolase family)
MTLCALAFATADAGRAMAAPRPLPVLLVHGIDDTGAIFEIMAPALKAAGRAAIYTIDLQPNNGDASLAELAMQVSRRVEAIRLETHADHVDLIGFSLGGMVSRYYVQCLGGDTRVRRLVTISSPHAGTIAAYFRWNAGAADMRPWSPFLKELDDSVEVLQRVETTSIWTPFDLMILPCWSSRLKYVKERVIPVLSHPMMVRDARVCRAVIEAIDAPEGGLATAP